MEFDVEERKQQLAAFSAFIDNSFLRIDDMLQGVGWTREYLMNENTEMVSCPLNPEHRVPKKSVDSHVQMCSWRREGYHELDVPLPDNPVEDFESTKSSLVIDASLQASIIKKAKEQDPLLQTGNLESDDRLVSKTSNRLMADFTPDERLVLYDYIISKTKPVEDVKVEELQMMGDMKRDEQPRPKSKLELLIEQRDAKRRRISYKKKVHTNRKSHTEILREVIQNQMELVEQIVQGECDDEKDEIFSLGGDEINLLSTGRRDHDKSNYVIKNTESVHDRERNVDQEMSKKNEYGNLKYKSSDSIAEDMGRRYDRNELYSETKSEKSETYRRSKSSSQERREWGEGRDYNSYEMPSTSFGNKTSKDRYHKRDYESWEQSRDYRSRSKNDHYHQSRRNGKEFGEYSRSKQHRGISKYDSRESNKELGREYHSYSRHHRHTSKHDSCECDLEYEKEYHSQPKSYKYSSKYDSREHDVEQKQEYEIRKSHNKFRNAPKSEDFYDNHNDSYDLQSNNSASFRDEDYNDSKTNRKLGEGSFQYNEVEVKKEKEEPEEDSKKCYVELKKINKKKRKKHHKRKSKKKHKKKYYSSSSSISSFISCSDMSDSNSDSS